MLILCAEAIIVTTGEVAKNVEVFLSGAGLPIKIDFEILPPDL